MSQIDKKNRAHYQTQNKTKNYFFSGSAIISSLYHVMYNPEFFPEPDSFKPERFLDETGKFVNDDHVVAFGIGKRYCLGKSLADKEYFLFFTGKKCYIPFSRYSNY